MSTSEIKVLGTRIPEECKSELRETVDHIEMIKILIKYDVISRELIDADMLGMIDFLSLEKEGLDQWTSGHTPKR